MQITGELPEAAFEAGLVADPHIAPASGARGSTLCQKSADGAAAVGQMHADHVRFIRDPHFARGLASVPLARTDCRLLCPQRWGFTLHTGEVMEQFAGVKVLFIAGFGPIVHDATASRKR
jgi:hypothetical protein